MTLNSSASSNHTKPHFSHPSLKQAPTKLPSARYGCHQHDRRPTTAVAAWVLMSRPTFIIVKSLLFTVLPSLLNRHLRIPGFVAASTTRECNIIQTKAYSKPIPSTNTRTTSARARSRHISPFSWPKEVSEVLERKTNGTIIRNYRAVGFVAIMKFFSGFAMMPTRSPCHA